jgi:hypothetical protein
MANQPVPAQRLSIASLLQSRGVTLTPHPEGGFQWQIGGGDRSYGPFSTPEAAARHALDLLVDLGVATLLDELDEETLLGADADSAAPSSAGPRDPLRWNNLAEGDLVEVTGLVGPYVVWGRPFDPRIVVIQDLTQPQIFLEAYAEHCRRLQFPVAQPVQTA